MTWSAACPLEGTSGIGRASVPLFLGPGLNFENWAVGSSSVCTAPPPKARELPHSLFLVEFSDHGYLCTQVEFHFPTIDAGTVRWRPF